MWYSAHSFASYNATSMEFHKYVNIESQIYRTHKEKYPCSNFSKKESELCKGGYKNKSVANCAVTAYDSSAPQKHTDKLSLFSIVILWIFILIIVNAWFWTISTISKFYFFANNNFLFRWRKKSKFNKT